MKNTAFILSAILSLLLQTSPATSQAEQWQSVDGSEQFLSVWVDMDTVQGAHYEDMVHFRLKADNHDDAVMVKDVLASCSEYSMEVAQETIHNKQDGTTQHFDWKHNAQLKQLDHYAQSRLSFWGYTQAYGKAIHLACTAIQNRYSEDLEAYVQENCAMSNPLYKVACAPHASWRANYKLYLSRSHDTVFNCDISEQRMAEQTAALLMNVMRCQSEQCGNQILERWINRRGADIAKVIYLPDAHSSASSDGDTHLCGSIKAADEEIASVSSREMFAKAKYMNCLKKETARLNTLPQKAQRAEKACTPQFNDWQAILHENALLAEDQKLPATEGQRIVFLRESQSKQAR